MLFKDDVKSGLEKLNVTLNDIEDVTEKHGFVSPEKLFELIEVSKEQSEYFYENPNHLENMYIGLADNYARKSGVSVHLVEGDFEVSIV